MSLLACSYLSVQYLLALGRASFIWVLGWSRSRRSSCWRHRGEPHRRGGGAVRPAGGVRVLHAHARSEARPGGGAPGEVPHRLTVAPRTSRRASFAKSATESSSRRGDPQLQCAGLARGLLAIPRGSGAPLRRDRGGGRRVHHGSVEWLREAWPSVRVVARERIRISRQLPTAGVAPPRRMRRGRAREHGRRTRARLAGTHSGRGRGPRAGGCGGNEDGFPPGGGPARRLRRRSSPARHASSAVTVGPTTDAGTCRARCSGRAPGLRYTDGRPSPRLAASRSASCLSKTSTWRFACGSVAGAAGTSPRWPATGAAVRVAGRPGPTA